MYTEYNVSLPFDLNDRPGRMPSPLSIGRLMESSVSPGIENDADIPVNQRLFDGYLEWGTTISVCIAKSRMEAERQVLKAFLDGPIGRSLMENGTRSTSIQRYDYATWEDLANNCRKRMAEVEYAQRRGDEHPPPIRRKRFN